MSKISPNMVKNICGNKNVADMFIDFDKYKDYFSEGSKEEYLLEIRNYIYDTFHKKLLSGDFIMEKEFMACTLSIFKTFFLDENSVFNEKLFAYLNNYRDLVNMSVERKVGPCSFDNADLRNQALDVANTQLTLIEKFFKEYKYEDKLNNALSYFDKYLPLEQMPLEDIKKVNELLISIGKPIDDKYVDLFFSNIMKNNTKVSFLAVENALRSKIHNYAESKGSHCYFEAKPMDIKDAGIYYDNIIRINDTDILAFSKKPKDNKERVFITFFHELRHFMQDQGYRGNRKFSYSEIKMLKDDLLFDALNRKYGRENYLNLSYELDAREDSIISTRRYFDALGIPNNLKKVQTVIKSSKKHRTDYRIVDIKLVRVDHLFDEFISNIRNIIEGDFGVNIFKEYPILNLMYDENCRRRTSLELFKRREELKSKNQTEEVETEIHNINEILYNQDLSFVNLVADYKEMITDNSLVMDPVEKERYIREYLYNRINFKSTISFSNLSFFIATILKRNAKEVGENIKVTIKNGKEIVENLTEIIKKMEEESGTKPVLKPKKTKK